MSSVKLSKFEAEKLLKMLKHSLISEVNFPKEGNREEFEVIGDTKHDIFTINIFRGNINKFKYNIGARIKKDGIMLLELHINPSNIHCNPNGEKIKGSHWHIYDEIYGRQYAFPADNIESDNFLENTIEFLNKFNVIEQPQIHFQLELT